MAVANTAVSAGGNIPLEFQLTVVVSVGNETNDQSLHMMGGALLKFTKDFVALA